MNPLGHKEKNLPWITEVTVGTVPAVNSPMLVFYSCMLLLLVHEVRVAQVTWIANSPTFYTQLLRSQTRKRIKDSQLKQLSGSEVVKAARKHIDEIDPWSANSSENVLDR